MKSFSLYAKVWSVVGVLIAGSAIIAYIGISKLESFDREVDDIVSETAVKVEIANELRASLFKQLYLQQTYILANTPAEMSKISSEIKKTEEDLAQEISGYKEFHLTEDAQILKSFEETYKDWLQLSREVREHAAGSNDAKAVELFQGKGHKIRDEILDYSDKLAQFNRVKMSKAAETVRADYNMSHSLIVLVSSLIGLLSILISVLVLTRLKKSISLVISNLSDNSRNVALASHQIASSSEELAQAASEQANSLEEAVGTLEKVNEVLGSTLKNTHEAATLADDTCQAALSGENEIRELSLSIREISEDSIKITEITHVIDDIAFQINILALNAAVEAARAGEQGKGFAVVAEAVRELAQKSASAASDISTLIKGSNDKISEKSKQVDHSVFALKNIVESAKKVAVLNSEIAAVFDSQSEGLSQVNKAMLQIDQATQMNAATSEEAAAAAEELANQSDSMNETIISLEVTINGFAKQAEESHSLEATPQMLFRSNRFALKA
ncbi:methyl-accepting chemotaxis protein [Bdellovibrio sp. KM01]|uniref:HAMP domain-containing methyl-accepting chemotaxis protein n=1 Tax=Bdellovibrio sp. KM01 TaxID=2748865 RepID=UPI0015EA4CBA|nr:methyl-accepting chemotaxis protein [Bdellovibrio sp. KM01]QLY25612.1 MCP four helix bundle domain-containing protein [Bdellovibrio sp. KM01]